MEYNLKELPKVAQWILQEASSKNLLFYGKMGSGKTTLIKSICTLLKCDDRVTSPTFSLVNEYHYPDGKIFHFDFYRIENDEEAWQIGFDEYLESPHYKLIEWPEKIPQLIPDQYTKIHLETSSAGQRKISLQNF